MQIFSILKKLNKLKIKYVYNPGKSNAVLKFKIGTYDFRVAKEEDEYQWKIINKDSLIDIGKSFTSFYKKIVKIEKLVRKNRKT